MIEIKPHPIGRCRIRVPGSKSYTHRTLIAAALADGTSTVRDPLRSQDTLLTLAALEKLGATVDDRESHIVIQGLGGRFKPCADPIYLANSGTSMRLLAGVAALGKGVYTLTGTPRMYHRPIGHLLEALNGLGIAARALENAGCPPVEIPGGQASGGSVAINCSVSSQFLSALLLMAPCTRDGMTITVSHGPVSRPYVDMTVDILARFGIQVQRDGYTRFDVPGAQTYRAGDYTVEPDASQAGYFWGAAAITGGSVTVGGVSTASSQGDVGLAQVFERMGCQVVHAADGITVTGGRLRAITVDMADMPDMVPTLAVVAAFAEGTTVIKNVSHLKAKESDRLTATCNELKKMGIAAVADADSLRVTGGRPRGAEIDTYDDHRMAMSFAMAGLVVPGVRIADPGCVEKSFPDFWQVWEQLRAE
ncbi:3-phosphoshikimate 1-carboxyvinyltransferase 2 [Desulfosarcina ovata subsp. sediminis]|uniref:3-phosphoshikimate 1-carboxyvinyltransferase n=1 Tax=Desulfosarcina ovata subsp. sediminis TaxID=885957 RepID=A0A5K7ZV16_9BACT|nr:3-phosphoshikimate 1-carboxyvinyltransferase [Desulfosarcina ovata]BBO84083.1 3-phosphoshikimate 1-carboxyvinyltransferase 2 [Desulfosarcina ovata subsp. sediminis]